MRIFLSPLICKRDGVMSSCSMAGLNVPVATIHMIRRMFRFYERQSVAVRFVLCAMISDFIGIIKVCECFSLSHMVVEIEHYVIELGVVKVEDAWLMGAKP